MKIEDVIKRENAVGIEKLSDEELAFLGAQGGECVIVGYVTVPLKELIEAARFEISRRQNDQAISIAEAQVHAAEAIVRMAEAQDGSARRLGWATWALVLATIGLIVATILR